MANRVGIADRSDLVGSLDTLRPTPAKAGLSRTGVSDSVGSSDGIGLGALIKDAVIKHYGSVKAAAISLNVDPSLMVREFEAGKIARLEQADPQVKAAIAGALFEAFGQLEDPKARTKRLATDVIAAMHEILAFLEYVA